MKTTLISLSFTALLFSFFIKQSLSFSLEGISPRKEESPKVEREEKKEVIKASIHKSFKRNEAIWGTYKQVAETIVLRRGKRKFVENTAIQTGDAILSRGRLVLVRLVREGEKKKDAQVVVKTFPYSKEKDVFQIDLGQHKEDFLELYGPKIKAFSKKKLTVEINSPLKIQTMTCKTQSPYLKCTIPVIF